MIPNYIPIVFHNLSRHDAHLFIRELGKKFDMGKIGVIAENKEKYISFNIDVTVDMYEELGEVKEKKIQLRLIDSFKFMAYSLDSLMLKLVGVSGMVCDNYRGSCELTHIDENYIAHGKHRNCYSGYSKGQLNVDSIFRDFANLRANHMYSS